MPCPNTLPHLLPLPIWCHTPTPPPPTVQFGFPRTLLPPGMTPNDRHTLVGKLLVVTKPIIFMTTIYHLQMYIPG